MEIMKLILEKRKKITFRSESSLICDNYVITGQYILDFNRDYFIINTIKSKIHGKLGLFYQWTEKAALGKNFNGRG